jgi:hypothetical protein
LNLIERELERRKSGVSAYQRLKDVAEKVGAKTLSGAKKVGEGAAAVGKATYKGAVAAGDAYDGLTDYRAKVAKNQAEISKSRALAARYDAETARSRAVASSYGGRNVFGMGDSPFSLKREGPPLVDADDMPKKKKKKKSSRSGERINILR